MQALNYTSIGYQQFHVLPVHVSAELMLCSSNLSNKKVGTVIDLNDEHATISPLPHTGGKNAVQRTS